MLKAKVKSESDYFSLSNVWVQLKFPVRLKLSSQLTSGDSIETRNWLFLPGCSKSCMAAEQKRASSSRGVKLEASCPEPAARGRTVRRARSAVSLFLVRARDG